MSEGWLYRTGHGQAGPVAQDALLRLVRTGQVTASTLLRREGGTDESEAGAAVPRAFATPPPYTGPAVRGGPWADRPPRSWRRLLARILDIAIVGDALFAILAALLPLVVPVDETALNAFLATRWGATLESFLATLLVLPANAVLTARFGTTLGKRAFRIRILKHGARLDFRTALRREFAIWRRGLAFGLPLVQFFAMAGAYHALKESGTAPWDDALGLRVSYKPLSRLSVAGLVLAVLVLSALAVLSFAL